MKMRRAVTVVVALALTGCGASKVTGTSGRQIRDVDTTAMPDTLNGLKVSHENIRSTLIKSGNTYVAAAALFSMRAKDLVQATLEVAHLTAKADDASPKFRLELASQVGGSAPDQAQLEGLTVYFTQATKQQLYVWFKPHELFVLSVRSDYTKPRSLLRAALDLTI